jgi:plastocyanin
MRIFGFSLPVAGAFAAACLTGCSGQGAMTPLTAGGNTMAASSTARLPVTMLAFDSGATVGINLTGQRPARTRHYGNVLAYFLGSTKTNSEVVTINAGSSVVFDNLDSSLPHTAAFLGDATKTHAPWPAHFNGGMTKSSAGTDISTSQFTTGTLTPGSTSAVYAANVPGFYMFGCQFHYDTHHMRTVIIVK